MWLRDNWKKATKVAFGESTTRFDHDQMVFCPRCLRKTKHIEPTVQSRIEIHLVLLSSTSLQLTD